MSYLEYITSDNQGEDPLQELSRTNNFTLQDLEENRKGRISNTQMGKLFSRALEPVKYPGMALLGWLLACFIVNVTVPRIALIIASMLGLKGLGLLFSAVTLACVGALFLAALQSAGYIVLLIGDLQKGEASFLDGRVFLSKEDKGGLGMDQLHGDGRRCYAYVIQNQFFPVDEAAANALPHGGRFRLYHTPRSKLLLSIEPAPSSAAATS
jgi:hypothetical protein